MRQRIPPPSESGKNPEMSGNFKSQVKLILDIDIWELVFM